MQNIEKEIVQKIYKLIFLASKKDISSDPKIFLTGLKMSFYLPKRGGYLN